MYFCRKFEKKKREKISMISKNDMKKTWQVINCVIVRGNKQSTQC